jgi:hypothetical protein
MQDCGIERYAGSAARNFPLVDAINAPNFEVFSPTPFCSNLER